MGNPVGNGEGKSTIGRELNLQRESRADLGIAAIQEV